MIPFAVFIGNYDANVRPASAPTVYELRAAHYRAQELDRELAIFDMDLERLRDRVENWGRPNIAYEQTLERLNAERAASDADLILRGRESMRARAESRNNPNTGLTQRQEQLFAESVAEIDLRLDNYRDLMTARREGVPFAPASSSNVVREMMFNRDLERLNRVVDVRLERVNRGRVARGESPVVFEPELEVEGVGRVVRPFAPAERSSVRDSFWFGGRGASLVVGNPVVDAFERPAVVVGGGDLRLAHTRSVLSVEREVLSGRRSLVSYQDRSSAYWGLMLSLGRGEQPTATRRERVAEGVFVPSIVGGRPRRNLVREALPDDEISNSLDGTPTVIDRDSPMGVPEGFPDLAPVPYPEGERVSAPNQNVSPEPVSVSVGGPNNWSWRPLGFGLDKQGGDDRRRTRKSRGKRQARKYNVASVSQVTRRMSAKSLLDISPSRKGSKSGYTVVSASGSKKRGSRWF